MARRFRHLEETKNKNIFFDANIIFYIFAPTGKTQEAEYSELFDTLLSNGYNIHTSFLVISEFINSAHRYQHKSFCKIIDKAIIYKHYRDSNSGKRELKLIHDNVSKFLKFGVHVVGKQYSKDDITGFISSIDKHDFNDKAILSLCKENNFILVTHDYDFSSADIDILSFNKRFFS